MLLIILLLPALAYFAVAVVCACLWQGRWKLAPIIGISVILIITYYVMYPEPENLWPIEMFVYGLIMLALHAVMWGLRKMLVSR